MNGNINSEMEDDELYDIVGNFNNLKLPSSETKKFKPWHHPRKQWVRAKHWCNYTEKLIKKFQNNSNNILTYLTLPGEDLLDIREIRAVCERNGFSIRYLGFNTAYSNNSDSEIEINHHDLMAMPSVHSESHIERDRLELVSNSASVAFQRFDRAGPFDVINIDLCNSIAVHSSKSEDITYYDMIKSMMDYQFKFRTDSWLLFLSSSVSSEEINTDAIEAFINIVNDNIARSADFKAVLLNLLNEENPDLRNIFSEAGSEKLVSLFGVSFCKWLLSICVTSVPKWSLHLEDVCNYNIQKGKSKMISLVIRFDREFLNSPDRYGLAKYSNKVDTAVNEVNLGINIVGKMHKNIDLDSYLTQEKQILENMKNASANLLEQARYSRGEYLEWCKNEFSI